MKLKILLLKMVKCEFHRRREIGELKKELERQKREADEAKKALEDKIAQELVLKGELDADEVSVGILVKQLHHQREHTDR